MPPINDPARDTVSVLGSTLRFKGELRADEDLVIKGHVEGSITHTKHLTISPEGRVKADINGQIVAVEGTVIGDVTAAVSIAALAGSSLTGEVRAPSVSIVEGAAFNGSVTMEAVKSAAASPPQASRATCAAPPESLNGTYGR